MTQIEKTINSLMDTIKQFDQIPYEEDYKRSKELNDCYHELNQILGRLQQLKED